MSTEKTLKRFLELLREQGRLESILGLLEWDTEVLMPPEGIKARGEQRAALAGILHQRRTSQEMQDLVGELRAKNLEGSERAMVDEVGRELDRFVKVPSDLVEAIAKLEPQSAGVWAQARKDDDFAKFRPSFEEILQRKIELADAIGYEDERYDALLDEFEPGMSTAMVAPVLEDLLKEVIPLSRAILAGAPAKDERLLVEVSEPAQEAFNRQVVEALGFDFNAGRLDTSTHPFCMGFHPSDVRMTTRYDLHDFRSSLYGTIHETGHGMYEQGLDPQWVGTPLGRWSSMGIHESQSRLWENIVGRSRSFWVNFLPKAQGVLPDFMAQLSLDDVFRGVNEVTPSLIRVESDEVHYNLHIILRFELERALVAKKLTVAEVPDAWRARSKELLDVVPETDREGCLQDIHWSMGMFGYFPTYTLGNLYAAMFWDAAHQQIAGLDEAIEKGEFHVLLDWLRENIHRQGRRYPVPELLRRVTGKDLDFRSHVDYLRGKYDELYSLN